MNHQQDQLEALRDIRNIMDRSSRFISLSGLSGVFAGVTALVGAAVAKWYLDENQLNYFRSQGVNFQWNDILFLLGVGGVVLVVAILGASFFTIRNARRKKLPVWDKQSKRLLINLSIPLGAGGAFAAVLLFQGQFYLVAPVMLLFYGLALVNASKYTHGDIRYLGLFEILLGIAGAAFPGFGLALWTLGFGVLHVVYGIVVYLKYER